MSNRFEISKVDPLDEDAVHDWSYAMCRDTSLRDLAETFDAEPVAESVVARLAADFPPATKRAAQEGCRAGFAERTRRLGPDK